MSEYPVNKGIGKSAEFKGLKSQYLFIFAGGLLSVFVVFCGDVYGGYRPMDLHRLWRLRCIHCGVDDFFTECQIRRIRPVEIAGPP